MLFDFGVLPPEINSGRMYSGPGAGPLLAAAAAWDGLAAELGSAASGYESVISGLTSEGWLGPSSLSMASAAAPYVAWMSATVARAEQAANQARAAVVAYETAFAMTVPPPVIEANRTLLMTLIATNFFAQNTPAIAATEAQYAQMWAQDAAAMYGYAGNATAASTLTPFTPPRPTTDAAGLAAQAATVGHAAGSSAASQPTSLTALSTTMPATVQPLSTSSASTMAATSMASSTSPLSDFGSFWKEYGASLIKGEGLLYFGPFGDPYRVFGVMNSLGAATRAWVTGSSAPAAVGGVAGGGPSFPSYVGGSGPTVSASVGEASTIGKMSVPPSWAGATPAGSTAEQLTPAAAMSSAESGDAVPARGPAGLLRGIPLAGSGGRGGGSFAPRYGFHPAVMQRIPAGG